MADVVISYSRLDQERVRPLAERLMSMGYTVGWDQSERRRQVNVDERAREVDAARAIIAVWSVNARDALHVYAEAAHGFDAGKLLQVVIDPVSPPAPFGGGAVANLTGAGEWSALEHRLSQLVRNPQGEARAAKPRLGLAPMLAAAGAPKLVTIAAIAALAAYAGALNAAFAGAMGPAQLQIVLAGVLAVGGACAGLAALRLSAIVRAGG